jgi:hypothetical protein
VEHRPVERVGFRESALDLGVTRPTEELFHGTSRLESHDRACSGNRGAHQSTVSVIQRGVRLGLFTAAEAELMIDRVRALATRSPLLTEGSYSFTGDGYATGNLLGDANRTV